MTYFRCNTIITNFVQIYFVTKQNKTWLKKQTNKKKQEELNGEMKWFQSTYTVSLCGIVTFDFSFYQHKIDPWRRYVWTNRLFHTVLTRTGVWTKIHFVIQARYNCLLYIKMIRPYILQHFKCASVLKHEEICRMSYFGVNFLRLLKANIQLKFNCLSLL